MHATMRLIKMPWWLAGLSIGSLTLAFIASLCFGQYSTSPATVWHTFFAFDPQSIDQIIVKTARLPRAVIACAVGASLAVAGVLMQTLTRNALASPAIFGVNAGAVFFIVLFSQVFSLSSLNSLLWIAFFGAAVSGGLVYGIGGLSRDGLSPLRVVLAGAAISALFSAFTQGILVIGQEGLDSLLFWVAGSVSGRELNSIMPLLPYMVAGVGCAVFLAPHINVFSTGDDIAKGLGQSTALLKLTLSVLIILLSGASVAVAGNIGFVGLIVPHMVRTVTGNNHIWLIPISAVWGATLLLFADTVSRFLIAPEELPIGVVTALLGAPLFIYLAKKGNKRD